MKARLNILISGGTGAGKTTFLNVCPPTSPIASESSRLKTRPNCSSTRNTSFAWKRGPPTSKARARCSSANLLINSLRMRPDRIIVGEVRGEEALDMLQAMNTGHDGSLTTIHANSPRDALSRLETMVAMGSLNIPDSAIRRQIASAIDVVVQVSRLSDGTRKVISIAEITGMEGEVVTMQDIFVYRKRGIRDTGEVIGEFIPTGIRPKFAERLAVTGIQLPVSMFEVPRSY